MKPYFTSVKPKSIHAYVFNRYNTTYYYFNAGKIMHNNNNLFKVRKKYILTDTEYVSKSVIPTYSFSKSRPVTWRMRT